LKKLLKIGGFLAGIINGLLGAGGGMAAVPAFEKSGISADKSHATALAIMLPLSILSGIIYFFSGRVDFIQTLKYIPAGIIGSVVGAWLLPKIPENLLRFVFGIFALWAGGRIIFK